MGSKLDIENDKISFSYKLEPGECSNSFGLSIARLCGLNEKTLKIAKEKADEFDLKFGIREQFQTNKTLKEIIKTLRTRDELTTDDIFASLKNSLSAFESSKKIWIEN